MAWDMFILPDRDAKGGCLKGLEYFRECTKAELHTSTLTLVLAFSTELLNEPVSTVHACE